MSLRVAQLAVLAVLICAACGTGQAGGGRTETSKGEIAIAFDGPLSGDESQEGLSERHGAQYAVETRRKVKGYELKFLAFDDAVNGKPNRDKGIENVRQMIADPRVLAMVGPVNSSVASAMIPVANQEPLAIVSAANTNPCLTKPASGCQPAPDALRPTGKNNYFRVAARDPLQAEAMAKFAVQDLKVSRAAVFSDGKGFGRAVADAFSRELGIRGGAVVVRRDFDFPPPSDFRQFLTAARDAGAQAIYSGVASPKLAGQVRAQMMQGIFVSDPYFLGHDGFVAGDFIPNAGSGANDRVYATVAAGYPTPGTDLLEKMRKAFPDKDAIGPYTFAAYDAAEILIRGIERALEANNDKFPTRRQVVDALAQTRDYAGAAGKYTFDASGDPIHPVLAVWQLRSGRWTYKGPVVLNPP